MHACTALFSTKVQAWTALFSTKVQACTALFSTKVHACTALFSTKETLFQLIIPYNITFIDYSYPAKGELN